MNGVCEDWMIIYNRLGDLYRELNTGDDDRATTVICGSEVRVIRTRINCTVKVVLQHKLYSVTWCNIRKRELTEFLYKRKNQDMELFCSRTTHNERKNRWC